MGGGGGRPGGERVHVWFPCSRCTPDVFQGIQKLAGFRSNISEEGNILGTPLHVKCYTCLEHSSCLTLFLLPGNRGSKRNLKSQPEETQDFTERWHIAPLIKSSHDLIEIKNIQYLDRCSIILGKVLP